MARRSGYWFAAASTGNGSGVELVHLGHSCVVLAADDARLLVDPGVFSTGHDTLEGLDAILVTHQHPDHLDLEALPGLLARNPGAELVVDSGTAGVLREGGIAHTVRGPGERFTVGGVSVDVLGDGAHEVIHPDIPVIANNGYLVGDGTTTVLHPGDAFVTAPERPDVLLLPTAAPWMAIADAIDYLRATTPPLAVPIHEGVLAHPGVYHQHFTNLAPSGTEVRVLPSGHFVTM